MALSGTFQNLPNGNFGVVCEWSGVQDIANNKTTITIDVYLRVWNVSIGSRTGTYDVGGNTGEWSAQALSVTGASAYTNKKLGSFTQSVSHNSSGVASNVTLSVVYPYRGSYSSTYYESITASTTVNLDTIPRYATVTTSSTAKTETSATIQWTADATCDYVWYKVGSGSWTAVGSVNATTGSYTVSGLSANTAYSISTRVRRKDSQLNTDSSAVSVTTYNYPYATTMPNFTIGDSVTIKFYNPLSRSITFYVIANGTQIANSYTTSSTSYSGINASSSKSQLYATIPNVKSASYNIKTVYGSSEITKTGGTFSIKESECTPAITNLTYQDTNSSVTNITGDNQLIVNGKSTVRYTASGLSAKNSATISSVKLAVNGSNYTLTVSGTSATGGNATISSGSNVTATATITDSRGLKATKSVTVTMADYGLPSGIITMRRQDGFYSSTSIKCDAQYSSVGGHNAITITYACTKDGDSSASVTGTLSDNVAVTKTLDNNYGWSVKFTLTDSFGGTTIYNTYLSRGTPLVFFDKKRNSVGFNVISESNNKVEIASNMSLVANGKDNIMPYLPYSWVARTDDTVGYERIATFTITGAYARQPIVIETFSRVVQAPNRVIFTFSSEASGTEPTISTFYYDGYRDTTFFIYRTASYTWDLYVEKSAGGDWITVYAQIPQFAQARINVSYTSNRRDSIPSGATVAERFPFRPFRVVASQYYSAGNFGIDMANSDLIRANGIYFNDTSNAKDEGLMFLRSNSNYDVVYAYDGDVYIRKDQDITASAVAGTRLLTTADIPADYVVAKYTEGNWTVYQWNSGTAECWGSFTVAVPASGWSAWGSIYEAQPTTQLKPSYPSGLFTATPEIQVSIHHATVGTLGCELYGTHSKTEAPRIIPLRPSSYSSAITFNVYMHAIGKWK